MLLKKLICLALFVTMIATLPACHNNTQEIIPTTTESTVPSSAHPTMEATVEATIPNNTIPSVTYHAPMTAVSVPLITETSYTKDGMILFSYTRQSMSLILQDPDVADDIIVDFLNRIDSCNATAKSMQSSAAAYTGTDSEPAFCRLVYSPIRLDEMVMSFYGTEATFDGRSRATASNLSVTYDLLTGNVLGLRDILSANYSATTLVELITEGLTQYAEDETLYPDYNDLLTDMFSTNTPVETWYFSQTGLCFYFNPYDIAPYSAGTIVSEIPYEKLGGLLKDEYFPAESVIFRGDPVLTDFNVNDTGKFRQFAELILHNNGQEKLLYADGTMLNVRISSGTWSADGKEFMSEAILFAASALSAGDALLIQAQESDLVNLCLIYETQGVTQQVPLSGILPN